jgi:hypothetical protein
MRNAVAALLCACAMPAAANNKPSAPPPHISAPAPHPAMAAPARPAMQAPQQHLSSPAARQMTTDAVHHGSDTTRSSAARSSSGASRYSASSARPVAAGAHLAPARTTLSHTGPQRMESAHAGERPGEHSAERLNERPGARPGAPGRAEEARAGGGRALAADDPARAHGRFDEHVRNPEREHDIARLHGQDFHVRNVRYFNDREWHDWRGGYWHNEYYDGRFGWWFDVGGVYYPYAAPIFPFPLVVAPLVYEDVPAEPPPPPGFVPLPALPQAAYHCSDPSGFYPALQSCGSGWTVLVAH